MKCLRSKIKDSTFLNLIDGTSSTNEETIESTKKVAKLAEENVEHRQHMFQMVN